MVVLSKILGQLAGKPFGDIEETEEN